MGNLIYFLIVFLAGWHMAHSEIAMECERQGNFYVGDVTYECQPSDSEGGAG